MGDAPLVRTRHVEFTDRTPLLEPGVPSQGECRCYAVIDAGVDPTDIVINMPPVAHPLRLQPPDEEDDRGLPWLVPMDPGQLPWLKARPRDDPWGVLVQSEMETETLGRALSDRLAGIDPNGDEVFIRWFDPRVLGPLLRRCNEPELRWWFEPVDAYGVLSEGWIEWMTGPAIRPRFQSIVAPPFRMTKRHLAAFDDPDETALIDEVRVFVDTERPGAFQGLDEHASGRLIRAAIARARSYGMRDVADLAAFAALMLDISPSFDGQPQIHAVLSSPLIPPGMKLSTAIRSCSEKAWEEAESYDDEPAWLTEHGDGSEEH